MTRTAFSIPVCEPDLLPRERMLHASQVWLSTPPEQLMTATFVGESLEAWESKSLATIGQLLQEIGYGEGLGPQHLVACPRDEAGMLGFRAQLSTRADFARDVLGFPKEIYVTTRGTDLDELTELRSIYTKALAQGEDPRETWEQFIDRLQFSSALDGLGLSKRREITEDLLPEVESLSAEGYLDITIVHQAQAPLDLASDIEWSPWGIAATDPQTKERRFFF